jgi:hypothetical protein
MTVTATEIDLTQWPDDELRQDVRRCMTALGLLSQESPARAGLARVIGTAVAELLHRSPAGAGQARATMCQCGEVFTGPDDSTIHFVRVFVPDNNVGHDGRVHQEILVPGGGPVAWGCPVPGPGHGAVPCEDGCRGVSM